MSRGDQPEMFLGQLCHDLPEGGQPELVGEVGGAEEARVEGEGAQGVGQLAAVQLEQAGDGVDVLTGAAGVTRGRREDGGAGLLARGLERKSGEKGCKLRDKDIIC